MAEFALFPKTAIALAAMPAGLADEPADRPSWPITAMAPTGGGAAPARSRATAGYAVNAASHLMWCRSSRR